MEKQIKVWVAILEHTKENILGTLNYNGLIIDDLEALIKDMQRSQGEVKSGIYPCGTCDKKIYIDAECKSCYQVRCPYDDTI